MRARHRRPRLLRSLPTIVLALALGALPCVAQPPEVGRTAEPLAVPRAVDAIRVDGDLTERSWAQALVLELAYEFNPGENIPAPVRTEALVTFDEEAVYFGFRAFDPEPAKIPAHYSDRDSIWYDDQLGVEIDTFGDARRSYSLFINPLGVQEDAVVTADGSFDFSWDAIWDAATRFHSWGYSAEIAISFASIRFQATDGPQVWGFNAMRAWMREKRHEFGVVPWDRSNNCHHCQLMRVVGFEGVAPGRNLEISPTLTATGTQEREDFPSGGMGPTADDVEVGATAHWGLTPNLTLGATANPDFSQVEADSPQFDINEPFALFYPEKRPFFTEGADFFVTPLDLVHTRTIRDPAWGAKLAGKQGRHTLGAYFARDDRTNLVLPGPQDSQQTALDAPSTGSVLRYAEDLNPRVTVGGVLTDRRGEDYASSLLALDTSLRLTDTHWLTAQAAVSQCHYPDELAAETGQPAGSFRGHALFVRHEYSTRTVGWYLGYEDVDGGFRSDLGFMPRVGYRSGVAGARRSWYAKPGLWWSRVRLGGELSLRETEDGDPLADGAALWAAFEGTQRSALRLDLSRGHETYGGREYDVTMLKTAGSFWPAAKFRLGLGAEAAEGIDYVNGQAATRVRLSPGILWNVGRHVALSLDHGYERNRVDAGRLYTARISQGTLVYQITLRTFLRAILHRVHYDRNAELYAAPVDPEYRRFFGQLLLSYKVNPRTLVFVGYSENALGSDEYALTEQSRTFFAKIGYAWLM